MTGKTTMQACASEAVDQGRVLCVPRLASPPGCEGCWASVPTQTLAHFHPRSSGHHPRVTLQAAHTGDALHLRFVVEDRYVRAVRTKLHDPVCRDSCVEAFLEPSPGRGYFNFEMNAIGTLHVSHVRDPDRSSGGSFTDMSFLAPEVARRVSIRTALSGVIDPEITQATTWWLTATIPASVFEAQLGPLGGLAGQTWRANFYKCADETSHPHWASWVPVGAVLDFHAPRYFAPIVFAE